MNQEIIRTLKSLGNGICISAEEIAWPIDTIPQVLQIVLENQWIILGGDVLTLDLQHTYDNWYYNPERNLSLSDNVLKSIQITEQYVTSDAERCNSPRLYALIISDTYRSGMQGTVLRADH